jgi:hypothetical protein
MSDRNDRHAKANCFHNAGCAYQTRKNALNVIYLTLRSRIRC